MASKIFYYLKKKNPEVASIKNLLAELSTIITEGSDWCDFGSSKLAFHNAITVRGWASCSFIIVSFKNKILIRHPLKTTQGKDSDKWIHYFMRAPS